MYVNGVRFTARPGRSAEVATGVVALRAIIERVTGVQVRAWSVVGGDPAGTAAISARLESMGQYVDGMSKLAADAEYQELGPSLGDAVIEPASIQLNRVVAMSDGFASKPFVSSTTAQIAVGRFGDAMAWCAELVEFIHSVTGEPAAFTTGAAGSFGSVGILVTCESGDRSDELHEELVANPGYLERLQASGPLFEPGSGHQRLLHQIA